MIQSRDLAVVDELHVFRPIDSDQFLVFHPETYSLFRVGSTLAQILLSLQQGESADDLAAANGTSVDELNERIGTFADVVSRSWRSDDVIVFDVSKDSDYRNRRVGLTLHVANACNLDCVYCYAGGGDYGRTTQTKMDKGLALESIDTMYRNFPNIESILFFGGEPTLAIDVIDVVCQHIQAKLTAGEIEHLPQYSMVSNGTLLDSAEAIRVIRDNKIGLTVSIDGPKEINDKLRPDKGGKGSYDKIKAGFDRVVRETGIIPSVEATFTQAHLDAGLTMNGVVDFLHEEFQFSVGTIAHVSLPQEHPLTIKQQTGTTEMQKTFRTLLYAIGNGERPKLERSFLMPLLQFVKKRGSRFTCSVGHDGFDITTDGDIYPCQVYINQDDFLMGNVHDFDMDRPSEQFLKATRRLTYRDKYKNPICKECWARSFCFTCPGSDTFSSNNYQIPVSFCDGVRGWIEFVLSVLYEVRSEPKMWANFLESLKILAKDMEKQTPGLTFDQPSIVPLPVRSPTERLYQIQGVS